MLAHRRVRSAWAAAVLAAAMLFFPAAVASAAAPMDLDAGYITDESGVLSASDEARLEERLSAVAQSEDLPELFVVLVPDFSEPSNALPWADQTALRNNLASDQYLLAIATEGRTLAISAEYGGDGTAAGPLSESRVLEIEEALGSRYLSNDDWAGGIAFVADEFSEVPTPWWVWALGVAGLALLIYVAITLVRFLRRRAERAAEMRTLEGQKKRAAQRLVRTDEAVTTSAQELGFVTAEFGDEATADFQKTLDECRVRLQEAFALLTRLEDSEKDTLEETRAWTERILGLCDEVDRALDGRTRALAALRSLAAAGPETVTRLRAARADAECYATDAERALSALSATYPAADLVAVARNPAEIARRLQAADTELDALERAVETGKPTQVERSVHEIERQLAEAKALRDAVEAQSAALAARASESPAGAPDAGQLTAATGSALDRATAAVTAAEASARARPGEVSAFALARLQLARRRLDDAAAAPTVDETEKAATEALALADQVQGLIGGAAASGAAGGGASGAAGSGGRSTRFVRPVRSRTAVMYDDESSESASPRSVRSGDSGDAGARVGGALSGGLIGGVAGFSVGLGADDDPQLAAVAAATGALIGLLVGAFSTSGEGGGGSSGWGGGSSSGSSWRSSRSTSSRSSSRSSSSRSSSSGSSRSSGRSGGRRF